MKLTAAKFALFVFVLLALGMLVTAAPQATDETDGTDTPSPIGGTDDAPTTPGTGKTGGGTSTGGGATGSDSDTDNGSTTKTPAKSGDDEEPSGSSSRPSGGSKNTPDEPAKGDDTSRDNDATPKTSQGSGSAKNNDDNNDDNGDRNNDNNNNNGNTRNGKDNNSDRNNNNNDSADSNNNAKGAKNADTTDDASQNEPTDSADPNDPVAQETVTESGESTPDELKLPINSTCTSDDVCESGLCQGGKCAEEKEDDDKIGKTLGMGLGIIVAVMCIGMVLLTGVRMMLKRRRSDYYSKRISEIAPSRATTPSFYHDSSSLVLEKQARNGNYAFQSPEAAISSDSVRPPAQGYVYGAADGYDMDQSYTRTGMPNYANDQHLYAPNAPANDWAVTPTYGAFPTTAAPDPNPIPVPQPTMLPVPAMSPIPPRNVQPAADPRSNGSNAFGNLHSGGAGERDSELIMYGGGASQNLTRESMYDASDDQQNDGGRYKMNSIYSAYGRDSLYADTKDTPSVPDVPDLPAQYQK